MDEGLIQALLHLQINANFCSCGTRTLLDGLPRIYVSFWQFSVLHILHGKFQSVHTFRGYKILIIVGGKIKTAIREKPQLNTK